MDDTATPNPDRPCPHPSFKASVQVVRIEPDDGDGGMPKAFMAEVTVRCAAAPRGCGEKFRWNGVPAGLSYAHPTASLDGLTLNAPMTPASSAEDFGLGLPGFGVQMYIADPAAPGATAPGTPR